MKYVITKINNFFSVVLYEVHKACISVIIATCEFHMKRADGCFINFLYINDFDNFVRYTIQISIHT